MVNTAKDRYLISPDFTAARFVRVCTTLLSNEIVIQNVRNSKVVGSPTILGVLQRIASEQPNSIEKCLQITDSILTNIIQFNAEIFENPDFSGRSPKTNVSYLNGSMRTFLRFIMVMRSAELLAWPMFRNVLCAETKGRHRFEWTSINDYVSGPIRPIYTRIREKQVNSSTKSDIMALFDGVLQCLNIHEIGDLTEEVVAEVLQEGVQQVGASGLGMHRTLNELYEDDGLHDLKFSLNKYSKTGIAHITDGLHEISKIHAHLHLLVALCAEYIDTRAQGQRKTHISGLKFLLNHIATIKEFDGNPLHLINGRISLKGLDATNTNYLKTWRSFFEFLLQIKYAAELLPDGRTVLHPDLINPIDLLSVSEDAPRLFESTRNPLPQFIIDELKKLLVEDDFAFGRARKSEYMRIATPNGARRVWVPSITVLMLLKLALPLRGFQTRVLDSGEADEWRYEVDAAIVKRCVRTLQFDEALLRGSWVRNTSIISERIRARKNSSGKPHQRGFLRRNIDIEGNTYITLFVNTNKTADINRGGSAMGYAMPYINAECIAYTLFLRNWIEKFLPISRLTRWEDCQERYFRQIDSSKIKRYPDTAFLFRTHKSTIGEPIPGHVLDDYWAALMQTLETRLDEKGIRTQAGRKIELGEALTASDGKNRYRPYYSLHTIRNGFVTNLLLQDVPIEIISKLLGHASPVMTAYYAKFGVDHVSEVVNAAMEKGKGTIPELLKALSELEQARVSDLVVAPDPTAIDRMRRTPDISRTVTDIGLCPNNCQLCHVGGQPLHPEGKVDAALPDERNYASLGKMDCTRCRFYVTGPAFLDRLLSYFSQVTWDLRAKSTHLQAKRAELETLEHRVDETRRAGEEVTALNAQIQRAKERLGALGEEADDAAGRWIATFRVIEDVIALAKRQASNPNANPDGSDGALLVVNHIESFAASFKVEGFSTTELELADWITQTAEVMESNVLTEVVDAAQLTRMQLLDRILKREGLVPIFFDLDPETARVVGNEMTRSLYITLGRRDANRIATGETTLKKIGLERGSTGGLIEDLQRRLAQISKRPDDQSLFLDGISQSRPLVLSSDTAF